MEIDGAYLDSLFGNIPRYPRHFPCYSMADPQTMEWG